MVGLEDCVPTINQISGGMACDWFQEVDYWKEVKWWEVKPPRTHPEGVLVEDDCVGCKKYNIGSCLPFVGVVVQGGWR